MSQSSNASSTSSLKTRFVPIDETDFNWDSVVIEPPKKSGQYSYSKLSVYDGAGKRSLSFQLADQNISGIKYDYGFANGKKRPAIVENIIGVQINYLLNDKETRDRIDTIVNKVVDAVERFYRDEDFKKKMPTIGPIKLKALEEKNTLDLIKSPFDLTRDGDGTVMYLPFITTGKASKIENHTLFMGRRRGEDYTKYIKKDGEDGNTKSCAKISLMVDRISFGPCGPGKDCVAQIKFKIHSIRLSKPFEYVPEQCGEENAFGDLGYDEDTEEEEEEEEEGEEEEKEEGLFENGVNIDKVFSTQPPPSKRYLELLSSRKNGGKK